VQDERLGAERDVELVDAVDAEAEALDARDRRAARLLRVGDDRGAVVDVVREVQRRTQRDLRRELAEVARRAEDEARARAVAEVTDAARAAEELQFSRSEGPEELRPEVVATLHADGHVAHLLEERRVVVV